MRKPINLPLKKKATMQEIKRFQFYKDNPLFPDEAGRYLEYLYRGDVSKKAEIAELHGKPEAGITQY